MPTSENVFLTTPQPIRAALSVEVHGRDSRYPFVLFSARSVA